MTISEAQQTAADEFFDEQMREKHLYFRVSAGRLSDEDTDIVFCSYYLANFDSEDEDAWPKLNYAHIWVRFAAKMTNILASGYEDAADPQYPQLDIFRSELPQEMAEWVIGQLEGKDIDDVLNHHEEQEVMIVNIKDEQIRDFFQRLDNVPRCEECSTPLAYLMTENKRNDANFSEGFGCPECGEIYCPFCFVTLRGEPICCEHLIMEVMMDQEPDFGPFAGLPLSAALDKYISKKQDYSDEGGWSERQKEVAFGALLPFYESCGANYFEFMEALPPVPGGKRVSYYFEDHAFWAHGFFCDKPEVSQKYYREQAANFVAGLNALAEMEPEGQQEPNHIL